MKIKIALSKDEVNFTADTNTEAQGSANKIDLSRYFIICQYQIVISVKCHLIPISGKIADISANPIYRFTDMPSLLAINLTSVTLEFKLFDTELLRTYSF